MRLTKHHGLGNDFLVLVDPTGTVAPDPDLARAACHRNRGVGADGLLYLGPGRDGAVVSMVLLNADGTRAEMSGNGIGCLTQAAVLAGLATPPTVTVSTDAGRRTVDIAADPTHPRTHVVTVSMGGPAVGDDLPEWVEGPVLRATRVEVGNPHLVLHVEALPDREWLAKLGTRANAAVPGGINVEVVHPAAPDHLDMDVFERGVGLTDACGTGAVASAVAAHRWGLVADRLTVRMHGGPTELDLTGAEPRMRTPVVHVATIEYPWS